MKNIKYRKKFKPNIKKTKIQRLQDFKKKKVYYSNSWDDIRRKVYQRDGYRCVMCGKKTKLHAHHIIPVKISRDNSLSNLVSVCEVCHRKLEAVGLKILKEGGSKATVRRVELTMIMEAKKERMKQYLEKTKNDNIRKEINENDDNINRTK